MKPHSWAPIGSTGADPSTPGRRPTARRPPICRMSVGCSTRCPTTLTRLCPMRRSAALTTETHEALSAHLDRVDGQEDLTFALYRPSTGATRRTGIVHELLLPRGGSGWQGMSPDDIAAEHGNAGKALAMTGYPLLGMTLGTGEMSWSARFWERSGGRDFKRRDCETVRVVGHQMRLTFNEDLRPPPVLRQMQVRTVSAWGPKVQADLARLRIAVIGAGSVGSLVAEALA